MEQAVAITNEIVDSVEIAGVESAEILRELSALELALVGGGTTSVTYA